MSAPFLLIERRRWWIAISGVLLATSIVAMLLSWAKFGVPVRLGLDFVGGTKLEYRLRDPGSREVTAGQVRDQVLAPISRSLAGDAIVQITEENLLVLRTKRLGLDQRDKLESLLRDNFGQVKLVSVSSVSPTIGPRILGSGLLAIGVALVSITMFVSYRFRRDFATCAIAALVHDVTVIVGLFAILGLVAQVEVNTLFLTACLTVLGFSVHDTIVVFDRVRENMRYLSRKRGMSDIINQSISQVWFRSLATSLTTAIALGSLLLFGGETTRVFSGALLTGIVVGTYSSIFVAGTMLYYLNPQKAKPQT